MISHIVRAGVVVAIALLPFLLAIFILGAPQ